MGYFVHLLLFFFFTLYSCLSALLLLILFSIFFFFFFIPIPIIRWKLLREDKKKIYLIKWFPWFKLYGLPD